MGLKSKSLILLVIVILTVLSMFLEEGLLLYLIIGVCALGCLLLIGIVLIETFGYAEVKSPQSEEIENGN